MYTYDIVTFITITAVNNKGIGIHQGKCSLTPDTFNKVGRELIQTQDIYRKGILCSIYHESFSKIALSVLKLQAMIQLNWCRMRGSR